VRHPEIEEGSRQGPEADGKARKLLVEDLEHRPWATHSKDRAPVYRPEGEDERSHGVPGGGTPLPVPKKRSKGAAERDEVLRIVWRMLCAYRRASVFRDPEKLRDEHHAASEPSSGGDGTFGDGRATTREVFEAYVEHFLAHPTPGEVVVMDGLGAHRPAE
jgi:hypothetical protein